MGYALEGWKVTYTRSYDTNYGEIGTVVNVTIGDTNIPLGHAGIGSNDESERNFARAEQIARLIAAAPELYEALEKLFDLMISDKVSKDEGVRRLQMAADVLAKVRGEMEG